mmetsp:Transcript_9593/g.13439  ORF Transcript_9593/g.13439 Transcript_9593/m.13439 type:complete len:95 (+) Transcript_9593:41-325(+)
MPAVTSLLQKSAGKQERSYKVVTWGFYGGGSTTGLHQLKLGPGEEVSPFPSIGLEVEKIEVVHAKRGPSDLTTGALPSLLLLSWHWANLACWHI